MPYKNQIHDGRTDRADTLREKIAALRAELARLEAARDTAVSNAKNPAQAEQARAAYQSEVDRARGRLTEAQGGG